MCFYQYMLERSRLGAEMLDQREETRILASKSEQSKMEAKFREMQNQVESKHKLECIEIRNTFQAELVPPFIPFDKYVCDQFLRHNIAQIDQSPIAMARRKGN